MAVGTGLAGGAEPIPGTPALNFEGAAGIWAARRGVEVEIASVAQPTDHRSAAPSLT